MHNDRSLAQVPLKLPTEIAVLLSEEAERDLVHALAELLLAIAHADDRPHGGGVDERQDR